MTIQAIPITNRVSWLALRLRDLTASDIGAVAGVDPHRTALRIFAEKTNRIPPSDDSDIMRRGRWLEAAVIEALRDERPTWDIRRAGVYLRDPAIRMGATPDAVATDPNRQGVVNIQCKVVARPVFEREWDYDPDTKIVQRAPLKFEVQTLTEGVLVEAVHNVIAALVIDTYSAELYVRELPRHQGAEDRIRAVVANFWADTDAGLEPPPNYGGDADVIAAMHPESLPGLFIDLTGDNRAPEILAEREALKGVVKAAEKRVGEIDTELKSKLGDAEEGKLPGWKLTWKSQTRAAHYVAESSFRVLRVTDRREKEGLLP